MTREIEARPLPGLLGVVFFLVSLWLSVMVILPSSPIEPLGLRIVLFALLVMFTALLLNGFFTVQPNQAEVLILLGNYAGSVRMPGWWFTNPIVSYKKLSLRVRSLNGERLKFVAEQTKKQGGSNTLDGVMISTIREQAGKKNYQFK